MARAWHVLSDIEFEEIVAHLLRKSRGVPYKTFPRGPDGGVDLRYVDEAGRVDIVQCKHYSRSKFSHLKSAMKKNESSSIAKLKQSAKVTRYTLATSMSMTSKERKAIQSSFTAHLLREQDILSLEDLELLLSAHPDVERNFPKLWISSGAHLQYVVNSTEHAKSHALVEEVRQGASVFVSTERYKDAREQLLSEGVLIIAGPPGIGKTTLAYALIRELAGLEHTPYEITGSPDEAWRIMSDTENQVFLYDDFLGRTLYSELHTPRGSNLLSLMKKVRAGRGGEARRLMILTTREYILRRALEVDESFRRFGLQQDTILLALSHYSRLDRAKILYNHIWHSPLPQQHKAAIKSQLMSGYRRIIDHVNYSPRLIEQICGHTRGFPPPENPDEWLGFAISVLDHPGELWRQAFERELDEVSRDLLLCLVTLDDRAELSALRETFMRWYPELPPVSVDSALRITIDTFIRSDIDHRGRDTVRLSNPGLQDFVQSRFSESELHVRTALRKSGDFDEAWQVWLTVEKTLGRQRKVYAKDALESLLGHALGETTPPAEFCAVRLASDAVLLAQEGGRWLQQFVEERNSEWADKNIPVGHAHALLRAMPSETPDALASVKSLTLRYHHNIGSWQDVVEFVGEYPGLFSREELEEVGEQFRDFAEGAFRDFVCLGESASEVLDDLLQGIEDVDPELVDAESFDIPEFERIASVFSVSLNERLLYEAYDADDLVQEASQRLQPGDGPDDEPDDDRRDSLRQSWASEQGEIKSLFSRFSDDE